MGALGVGELLLGVRFNDELRGPAATRDGTAERAVVPPRTVDTAAPVAGGDADDPETTLRVTGVRVVVAGKAIG